MLSIIYLKLLMLDNRQVPLVVYVYVKKISICIWFTDSSRDQHLIKRSHDAQVIFYVFLKQNCFKTVHFYNA